MLFRMQYRAASRTRCHAVDARSCACASMHPGFATSATATGMSVMRRFSASIALLCACLSFALPAQAAPDGNLCGRKERAACFGYCSVAHPNGAGMKECVAACEHDGVPCGADGSPERPGQAAGAAVDAKRNACVRSALRDCGLRCRARNDRAACREACRGEAEASCDAPS